MLRCVCNTWLMAVPHDQLPARQPPISTTFPAATLGAAPQLLGSAATAYSGPAVFVSVLISGLAALLTSVCYGELAVEYPLSGAAFSYTMVRGACLVFCSNGAACGLGQPASHWHTPSQPAALLPLPAS